MFEKGDEVTIHGLKSKLQWNGKAATISGDFNWEKGRYPVALSIGNKPVLEEALLRPRNLRYKIPFKQPPEQDDITIMVRKTPDRGYTLMFPHRIKKGTVIFTDCPLISIPRGVEDGLKVRHILEQYQKLGDDQKQIMLSYHSQISVNKNPNFKPDSESTSIDKSTVSNDNNCNHDDDDDDHKNPENTNSDCSKMMELVPSSKGIKSININTTCRLNKVVKRILGVYYTNSFTITHPDSPLETAFFPLIARMNHCCFPNCEVLPYDPVTNTRSVVALHDVEPYHDLCIDYIGNSYYTLSMLYEERKQYIESHFAFECRCNQCWPTHAAKEGSRAAFGRSLEIIDEEVHKFNKKAFRKVLAESKNMIQILDEVFNGWPTVKSQCYVNAAHALLLLNRYQEAMEYLKKTIEIDTKYYGKYACFDDVNQCLAKIPRKLKKDYPWKHVMDLEAAKKRGERRYKAGYKLRVYGEDIE